MPYRANSLATTIVCMSQTISPPATEADGTTELVDSADKRGNDVRRVGRPATSVAHRRYRRARQKQAILDSCSHPWKYELACHSFLTPGQYAFAAPVAIHCWWERLCHAKRLPAWHGCARNRSKSRQTNQKRSKARKDCSLINRHIFEATVVQW